MALWSASTAELLGMYLVPGGGFFLTRDLLVYKPGSFLAAGMLGLCGSAMYPRKKRPFLDFTVFPSGHLDPVTWDYIYTDRNYTDYKHSLNQNIVRARDYACFLFDKDGRETSTGKKSIDHCVERGRMADPSDFL